MGDPGCGPSDSRKHPLRVPQDPSRDDGGKGEGFSRAYFSCQKGGRFAIELANATAPDDPKGLRPRTDPRLYCNRPIQPWDEKLAQEELLARWDVNEIGDALAQGFRPFPLRECVSIRVIQEVVLPPGWAQRSAKVEFDILPYNRELDAVFATCGEVSAYGPAAPVPAPVASAPLPQARRSKATSGRTGSSCSDRGSVTRAISPPRPAPSTRRGRRAAQPRPSSRRSAPP